MPRRTLQRRSCRAALALLVFGIVGMWSPGPASAHTDLDYTLPGDGASIGEPLTEITVGFTQPVTVVGPGFEVLSPQGELVQPFAVTDDDMVFRLQIDPPLGGGAVGVRYEVTAPDGHVIAGSFSFVVSVDAPAPIGALQQVPATTEPVETASGAADPDGMSATGMDDVHLVAAAGLPADLGIHDRSDGGAGLYIAMAAAVAVAAGAFLLLRRQSIA